MQVLPAMELSDLEATRPPLIVVADDDQEMRRLIVAALRTDGYDVLEAADGAELLFLVRAAQAINGAASRRPALVVSDIQMPYASGIDAIALLRAEWIAVPFVLLSAFLDDATKAVAIALGSAAVLSKPFEMDALRNVVAGLVPAEP